MTVLAVLALAGGALLLPGGARAQNATWLAAPASTDFNTAANWSPAAVPTGVATFGVSNTTGVTFSADTTFGGWTFSPVASNYLFANGNALTFDGAGIIVNGGSVGITNTGAGSIAFINSATAGNAVFANAGVLAFQNFASAGTANIVNAGLVDFADTTTAAAASITSSGGGLLQFRNNASAGFATIITNSGSSTTFADQSSGGTSRQIVNAGGALDISFVTAAAGLSVGSLEGAGSVFLGSETLIIGGNGLSTTFSGQIQDGGVNGGVLGSLTKVGAGTLVLSGANTYTGMTTVDGGTLLINGSINAATVNAGGTLGGNGSVGATQVNAGGIFAPGTRTPGSALSVAGNLTFQAGASYAVSLNPTTATSAAVNGIAALNGANLVAQFAPGNYVSRQYTILSATAGVVGTFSGIANVDLPAGTRDTLTYGANAVILNLLPGFTGYTGLSVNQSNVASTLANYFSANGGIAAAFFGLTPAGLTQVDGEVGTGAPRVAFQSLSEFLGLMLDPFVGGRSGAGSIGSPAAGFAPGEAQFLPPGLALAYAPAGKAPAPAFSQRWTSWGAAYGSGTWADGSGSVGSASLTAQTAGVAAGMDYHYSPDTVFGLALAGGGGAWQLASALGSGRDDAFQIGAYAMTRNGPAYLAGAVAFANNWFSTDRSALGDLMTANFAGQGYGGRGEAGYRFAVQPGAGITPYGALQTQIVRTPGYAETDQTSGLLGLAYAGRSLSDVRTEIGSRFDSATTLFGMLLILRSKLAFAHDFVRTPSLYAAFQALPGTAFTVFGAPIPQNSALASGEAELFLAPRWTLAAKVDGAFARGAQTLAGTGTLRYVW